MNTYFASEIANQHITELRQAADKQRLVRELRAAARSNDSSTPARRARLHLRRTGPAVA